MNVYCKNCGTYDIMSVAKLYQTRSAKHGCAWIIIISCANAHDIMSVAKLYGLDYQEFITEVKKELGVE